MTFLQWCEREVERINQDPDRNAKVRKRNTRDKHNRPVEECKIIDYSKPIRDTLKSIIYWKWAEKPKKKPARRKYSGKMKDMEDEPFGKVNEGGE